MIRRIFILIILMLMTFSGWGQNTGKYEFPLPSNPEKLIPLNTKKIEFGWNIILYNIWQKHYHFETTFLSDDYTYSNREYFRFDKPLLYQFDLAYRIRSGLKAGLLTHRRKAIIADLYVRPLDPNIGGQLYSDISFGRSWGVFLEYSPFPVEYLRLRRWEVNLGGGITREKIQVKNTMVASYSLDPGNWWDPSVWVHPSSDSEESFQVPGGLIFGRLNVYLSRWLSLNTKIGYYFLPTLEPSSFLLDLPGNRPDLRSSPEPINLSWHYYSFGFTWNI